MRSLTVPAPFSICPPPTPLAGRWLTLTVMVAFVFTALFVGAGLYLGLVLAYVLVPKRKDPPC